MNTTQMKTLVSAIVLNYRSFADTVTCVEALLKQTVIDELQILCVDNCSGDGTAEKLRQKWDDHPKVRVVEMQKNYGFGGGCNRAVGMSRGEFLIFINPDNTFPPDGLEKMINCMNAHPELGILGPGLEFPDGTLRPSARPYPRIRDIISKRLFPARWEAKNQFTNTEQLEYVDWVVGTCLMIRRDFFHAIGGFDERYFLFFEDTDLCRKANMAGKKVGFHPGIRIADRKKRLSDGGLFTIFRKKTARIHLKSALHYFWKWAGKSA